MQISQTTKWLLWGGSWSLSIAAAFGVGFWVASSTFETVFSTNYLTRELVEAIQTQHILEQLDNQSPETAQEGLSLRMDGHILMLASLSEHSTSEKDRAATNKFLRKVAEHRRTHKSIYTENLSSSELDKAQAMIAEILKSREINK